MNTNNKNLFNLSEIKLLNNYEIVDLSCGENSCGGDG